MLVPYSIILAIAFSLFGCAPTGKKPLSAASGSKERETIPQSQISASETALWQKSPAQQKGDWAIPPSAEKFTGYKNRFGFKLKATPNSWYSINPRRSERGRPAIRIQHKTGLMRISLFDISPIPNSEIPLDSILGYLFKVTGFQPEASMGNYYKLKLEQVQNANHKTAIWKSDSNLVILFCESKRPQDFPEGEFPGSINISVTAPGKGALPGPENQNIFLSVIHNTSGLMALADSSYNSALQFFKKAWLADSLWEPHLSNIAVTYHAMDKTISALSWLKPRMDRVKKSSHLMGLVGAFYESLSQWESALYWAEEALKLDGENEEWLVNLSDALWQTGHRVMSKNVLFSLYKKNPSFRLSVYLAGTHLGLEEYHYAERVLNKAHLTHTPTKKSIHYTMLGLNGLKRHTEALSFFRKHAGDSITALQLIQKATAEFQLKYYLPADYSIRKALKMSPLNDEARELAANISAALGDKSNLILSQPLAAVKQGEAFPSVQKLAQGHRAFTNSDNTVYILNRQVKFLWNQSGGWKSTKQLVYFVNVEDVLSKPFELTFEFNPGYSKLYINRYDIYDKNLNRIHTGKLKDFYVTRNFNESIHPENLLLHLPINPRKKPFFIDLRITEASRHKNGAFPYLKFIAKTPHKCLNTSYEIIGAPENLNINVFGRARLDSTLRRLRFSFPEDIEPLRERFAPAFEEYGSGFTVSPMNTWNGVGKEYLEYLKRSRLYVDSIPVPVEERVVELTQGRYAPKDPIQAIFRFVRDSIKYDNVEFGLHALLPEHSRDVLLKKFGDCKGHALLLAQMLNSLGIQARLALTNLSHTGIPSQPSLHQFNHMLVYFHHKAENRDYFLDPTEKFHPFRQVPLPLEGKIALLITPDGGILKTIPELSIPGEHLVEIYHNIEVNEQTLVRGADSIVIRGKLAWDFRTRISKWRKLEREETLISWISDGYKPFEDGALTIKNLNFKEGPLNLVFKYSSRQTNTSGERAWSFASRLEQSFLRFPRASVRKMPVYFPFSIQIKSQWNISYPKSYAIQSACSAMSAEEKYLSMSLQCQEGKLPGRRNILINSRWQLEPVLMQADEYKTIYPRWMRLLELSEKAIVLKD